MLSYVKSVKSGGDPSAPRPLGWQAAQLPLFGLLKSASPCNSRPVSVARPDRNASYLLSKEWKSASSSLVLLKRESHAVESRIRRVEDPRAEDASEFVGIGCGLELLDHRRRRAVRHLMRREQRTFRLDHERIRAAVAIESARRRPLLVEEEGGVEVQVTQ